MSEITIDEKSGRFEWDLQGQKAFLLFRPVEENTWAYTYVFVPPAFRGQQFAEKLTRFALEYARERGVRVQPVCPYIRAYAQKNREEFADILA